MNKRGQYEEFGKIIMVLAAVVIVLLGIYYGYNKIMGGADQLDVALTAAVSACNNAGSLGDSGKAEFCRSRTLVLDDGKTHFMNCDTGYLSAYVDKNNPLIGSCKDIPLVTCSELQSNSEYLGETVVIGGTDGQACEVKGTPSA